MNAAADTVARLTDLQRRVYEVQGVCQVTSAAANEDEAIQAAMKLAARELQAIASTLGVLLDDVRAGQAARS
jgi:hypothetical protein